MDKKKYKDKLKKVGNETLVDLEPVVVKNVDKLFDVVKEFVNDFISVMFKEPKNEIKKDKR